MGLEIIWVGTTIVASIGAAVVLILSKRRQDIDALVIQRREELTALANTRKETIEQLREEMHEMQRKYTAEIANLNSQIAELRGQYDAMRRFQVNEIIGGVTAGVLKGLALIDAD